MKETMTIADNDLHIIGVTKSETTRILDAIDRSALQEIELNKILFERLQRELTNQHEINLLKQETIASQMREAVETSTVRSLELKERTSHVLNEAMINVAQDLRNSTVTIAGTLKESNIAVAHTLERSSTKISFLTQLLIAISFFNFMAMLVITYLISR